MFDIAFDYLIKGPLYSKIYTEHWEDIADGGPTCAKELTIHYRASVAVLMAVFQYSVLMFSLSRVHKKFGKVEEPSAATAPHLIERVCGWASILVFCVQICYKFSSGKGIFLLNPCHVVLVLEAYVLLQPVSEKSQVMYANVVSLLFSPVCGILYAADIGLEATFEHEFYWIEHYMGAVINPLALALSGRYHERKFFHPYYRLIGFAFFSLYHRLVLLPIALFTWANLDQTLCHAETDPFYSTFGDWYYLMADFYIPIASNLIGYSYLLTCEIVAGAKSLVLSAAHKNGVTPKEVKTE